MAKRRVTGRPGLFGTVYYYDENGKPIGKSRPGLIKGTRVYSDQNGRYAGKSRSGFLAKEVFTDSDGDHITSYDSICGQAHYTDGKMVGYTTPGLFDTSVTDITEDRQNACCEDEAHCQIGEDAEYMEEQPEDIQNTVIKNVRLLLLCLAICAVIACVYAVVRLK